MGEYLDGTRKRRRKIREWRQMSYFVQKKRMSTGDWLFARIRSPSWTASFLDDLEAIMVKWLESSEPLKAIRRTGMCRYPRRNRIMCPRRQSITRRVLLAKVADITFPSGWCNRNNRTIHSKKKLIRSGILIRDRESPTAL